MSGPDNQSVLGKQVDCFVHMQGVKDGKQKGLWETVSGTQIAHQHSRNLDDFQRDIILRTAFECYDKCNFSTTKNVPCS
jgi:hypothetical protein